MFTLNFDPALVPSFRVHNCDDNEKILAGRLRTSHPIRWAKPRALQEHNMVNKLIRATPLVLLHSLSSQRNKLSGRQDLHVLESRHPACKYR